MGHWVIWRLNKETTKRISKEQQNQQKVIMNFSFSDQEPVQQLQQLIPAYEHIMKVIAKILFLMEQRT